MVDSESGKQRFIGRFPTREAATEALDDAKAAEGARWSAPIGPGDAASPGLEAVGVGGGGGCPQRPSAPAAQQRCECIMCVPALPALASYCMQLESPQSDTLV